MNASTCVRVPFFALVMAFAGLLSVVPVACSTAPSNRVQAVQTLKAVGQSAEAAVTLAAQLFRDGKINAAQAQTVVEYYDQKFQPAFRLAVAAVNSDLSSVASPDILALANQLSAMVIVFQTHH
jgi:hypothetical protein